MKFYNTSSIRILAMCLWSYRCCNGGVSAFQSSGIPQSIETRETHFNAMHTASLSSHTSSKQRCSLRFRPYTTPALSSMNKLLQEIESSTSTSSSPKTIFVGGKGGVGKTTISASLAVQIATSTFDGSVLVVSTDPAHSLGDALDASLTGEPTQMTDPLTMGKLYAMEMDCELALEQFQESMAAFDVQELSQNLGLDPALLDSLGLGDLNQVVSNPPPGLDELVALADILGPNSVGSTFDVILVDTAPTGHTLRLLALPEFLNGFLDKLLSLREKLKGVAGLLSTFMGGGGGDGFQARVNTVDRAVQNLEDLRLKMSQLKERLVDPSATEFVVVSVPTQLSVKESKRLLTELDRQHIKVGNVVLNQCVVGSDGEDVEGDASEAVLNYYTRRRAGQGRWLDKLESAIQNVATSPEYQSHGRTSSSITLTQVPFFDVELVGTPALGYLGSTVFANNPDFDYLLNPSPGLDRFIICGGKGGVGKTTTSSTLGVSMAAAGRNVALISTDPAHSLGDAFDMEFGGGTLVDVPLIGVPATEGTLSVLEVDPAQALGEFKGLVDQLLGRDTTGESNNNVPGQESELGNTLRDLGSIFDTLPAGTDEVVALAKVVGLLQKGNFDRVILDTAPTGHTLRMLSTPGFVSDLIEKVLAIAEKVNSNAMVKMMIANAAGSMGNGMKSEDLEESAIAAKRALLSFQSQMYDLEDLFSDADQTEFLIVTVPTELAVRESSRLLNDLTFEAPDMPIKVRNVVANQVLKNDGSDVGTFLSRVADVQKSSIRELRDAANDSIEITEVPYLDTEPRGVFGLKALSAELLKNQ